MSKSAVALRNVHLSQNCLVRVDLCVVVYAAIGYAYVPALVQESNAGPMQYTVTMFAILSSCVFGLSWTQHSQPFMLTCNCLCMGNHNAESQSDGLRFN